MDGSTSSPTKQIRVAIGIIEEGGLYLIARRPKGVDLPDLWEFPGGKQEPGETPEAAAVRELKEELGITVAAIGRLPAIEHDYPHARITLTPILCQRLEGDPQPLQAVDPCWVDLQTLQSLPMPTGNATLLHELVARRLPNRPASAE